jgi:hypothetical protein
MSPPPQPPAQSKPTPADTEPAGLAPIYPIEPQFGPLRTFVLGGSGYRSHTVLARRLQSYLHSRNAHAHHPDALAAQRRERARIRSERQHSPGRPKAAAA